MNSFLTGSFLYLFSMGFLLTGFVAFAVPSIQIGYAFTLSGAFIFPPIRKHLLDTPFKSLKISCGMVVIILALGIWASQKDAVPAFTGLAKVPTAPSISHSK